MFYIHLEFSDKKDTSKSGYKIAWYQHSAMVDNGRPYWITLTLEKINPKCRLNRQ